LAVIIIFPFSEATPDSDATDGARPADRERHQEMKMFLDSVGL
jgi:hypothetical protein